MSPTQQRPKSPPLAFLLAQVGAHAAARFAERLAPLGLVPAHAGILRLLQASAGLSQQQLGGRLNIHPSRLVAIIDELEARQLIERRVNPADRRTYALHLSTTGKEILKELGRVGREHSESLFAALTRVEREQLANLLLRIADEQGLAPGVHPGYARLRAVGTRQPDDAEDPKMSTT
jgi:DNA-binding MarR family transcriptional regulator